MHRQAVIDQTVPFSFGFTSQFTTFVLVESKNNVRHLASFLRFWGRLPTKLYTIYQLITSKSFLLEIDYKIIRILIVYRINRRADITVANSRDLTLTFLPNQNRKTCTALYRMFLEQMIGSKVIIFQRSKTKANRRHFHFRVRS